MKINLIFIAEQKGLFCRKKLLGGVYMSHVVGAKNFLPLHDGFDRSDRH